MSKYRRYQVGEYWLSQRDGSPAWYRTWYDSKARQTKRASLGTENIREAEEKLNAWFIEYNRPQEAKPEEVLLADVLLTYYNQHAIKLRSGNVIKGHLAYWSDFFSEAHLSEITVQRQEDFHEYLRGFGHSESHIQHVITSGKAALNRAWKRGELERQPLVINVKVPKAKPKGRPLSVNEMSKLLGESDGHLKLFLMLMIGTASRPEAILELDASQLDFENRLIHLNPPDRVQTKKYRPTVKMPESLVPMLEGKTGALISWKGKRVGDIKNTFRKARDRAKLTGGVVPYSVRHTMARWLRQQGVDAWQVAAQLGHQQEGMSTTEIYAPYSPDYLKDASEAIELFFAELRSKSVPE